MNKTYPLLALPLLLAALPSIAADTPTAHLPHKATPGDFREFATGLMSVPCQRWEFKSIEDGDVISQCADNQLIMSLDNDLNPVAIRKTSGETLVSFKPFYPQVSYPLTVGKQWAGEYSGYTADDDAHWDSKVSCKVEAYEKLKVAAGEFDTFRIACVDQWRSGILFSGETRSTRWYAPKVAGMVKVVHDKPKWNIEMVNFQIQ